MKEIRVAYSDLYNAGDLMNVDIIEKVGNCKIKRSKTFCADMIAIGGALVGLQYPNDSFKKRICYKILHPFYNNKPIYVWGSGFIYNNNSNTFYRNNLKVCALRGAKSQKKLQELTGKYYDVPLADAGLLVDMLIEEIPQKEYKIGLIPHMWHQEEPEIKKMSTMDGVHVIDIKQTPQRVAYEIAKCETILSSSLHGLIFADSMHIPNMHFIGNKELLGGNFKYEDYYSSYGLDDEYIVLSECIPTYNDIITKYRISKEVVENKKIELIENFPYELTKEE